MYLAGPFDFNFPQLPIVSHPEALDEIYLAGECRRCTMEPPNIAYSIKDQQDHHLGDKINIATRSAHTKLNKGLLQRIPLALPPIASTPSVYVSGLIHVAPIYIAFESKWRDILKSEPRREHEDGGPSSDDRRESLSPGTHDSPGGKDALPSPDTANERIHSLLSHLHLPVLERSSSLRADIRSITGWSEDVVDEQIAKAAERGALGEFVSHIKRSVDQNPHVLLAYAWVLYMALFSGGRFIRGSLENAGAGFWNTISEPVLPFMVPCEQPILTSPTSPEISPSGYEGDDELSAGASTMTTTNIPTTTTTTTTPKQQGGKTSPLEFFRFATPQDGEDLKTEFKRRLVESESRLKTHELEDVVQEASRIFDSMNLLVAQLDCVFGSSSIDKEQASGTGNSGAASYVSAIGSSLESWARLLIPGGVGGPRNRLRDSVAIAKERGLRPVSRGNRSSNGSDSSVASSEMGERNGSSAAASLSNTGVGTGAGAGVSILQARGTLIPSAELFDKTAVLSSSSSLSAMKHEAQQDGGCGLTRSKSVRFGKDVAPPGKKPAGLVRHKSKKRVVHPQEEDEDKARLLSHGGLDGADEYEYEFEDEDDDHTEAEMNGYAVCPIVAKEKHVRFLTPGEDENRGSGAFSVAPSVRTLWNGLVVLGLVGVVVGVGRLRI